MGHGAKYLFIFYLNLNYLKKSGENMNGQMQVDSVIPTKVTGGKNILLSATELIEKKNSI